MLAYLKGQIKLTELPKILQGSARDLQKEIIKTKDVFGNLLPEGDLKKFLLK